MKKCTYCKIEKENSFFSNRKTGKNGLDSRCISCQNERQKKWRLENHDKKRLADKKWLKKNKEKSKLIIKKYQVKNRLLLKDNYIISLIKKQNLPITHELIELKRVTIQIDRLIKQKS